MNDAERFEQIFLSQVVRPGADKLLEWLKSTDFFTAPASTRFHGAYPGGLVKHSLNVYYALLGNFNLRGLYSLQTQTIVALLHDVCKANYYAGEYPDYTVKDQMPMGRGEIVKWEAHPCFLLFPAGEYNGVKLRSVQYTADFRLTYADGTVEIVEVKSKFVRRMQRDYPVRRRVFLELIARPAGWKFTEIITAEDKEEIKRWRELAEEVSSCGKNG